MAICAPPVSETTTNLDSEAIAWRARPLEPVWPIVHFDRIVVNVRGANGRASGYTIYIYVAVGGNLGRRKELHGQWLSQIEKAKFQLSSLTDLNKLRGLLGVFVACIDGVDEFADVMRGAYPQAKVELSIAASARTTFAVWLMVELRDWWPELRDRIRQRVGVASSSRLD